LVPVMRLAEQVDLAGLVAARVRPDLSTGSNPGGKAAAVVAGMVAGADSIDDLNLLRHGGLGRLFGSVYVPSTLGSFLRFFSWGHGLQLEAAGRDVLAALARRTPLLPGAATCVYVDVDSLLRRVYGHGKQGAGFGHAKVGGYKVWLRGLSPLVATLCTDQAAPVVAAGSARGAASLVKQAIATARTAGADGQILVRADSAFGSGAVVSACRTAGVNFSITLQSNPKLRSAIAGIGEDAWTPVRYPGAVYDDELGQWISNAEVAETGYTAFETSRHKVTAGSSYAGSVSSTPPTRAGRAVPDVALPCVPDRYRPAHRRSRPDPPRPRHRRAGLRRSHRRALGAPAVRSVRRQRRMAQPRRHGPQPAARRQLSDRPALRHGTGRDRPPAPGQHPDPHRPPRPPHHPAPTGPLAVATGPGKPCSPASTTHHQPTDPAHPRHPVRRAHEYGPNDRWCTRLQRNSTSEVVMRGNRVIGGQPVSS
jgi:hypothetical protein